MTKTIFLDIDLDDESTLPALFANHKIEIEKTNHFFIQSPIFRLTSDEKTLRDWILTVYHDTADSEFHSGKSCLDIYMNQLTPESITL